MGEQALRSSFLLLWHIVASFLLRPSPPSVLPTLCCFLPAAKSWCPPLLPLSPASSFFLSRAVARIPCSLFCLCSPLAQDFFQRISPFFSCRLLPKKICRKKGRSFPLFCLSAMETGGAPAVVFVRRRDPLFFSSQDQQFFPVLPVARRFRAHQTSRGLIYSFSFPGDVFPSDS